MKKITITIDQEGNSTIEASGFSGGECLAATKSFEEALGKLSQRTMKRSDDTVGQGQMVQA